MCVYNSRICLPRLTPTHTHILLFSVETSLTSSYPSAKQEITYWPAPRLFLLFFPPKKFLIVVVFKLKKKTRAAYSHPIWNLKRKKERKLLIFFFFNPYVVQSLLCSYTMIYICLFSFFFFFLWGGGENIREEGAFGFDLIRCLRVVYLLLPKKKKLLKRVEKKKKIKWYTAVDLSKNTKNGPNRKETITCSWPTVFFFH